MKKSIIYVCIMLVVQIANAQSPWEFQISSIMHTVNLGNASLPSTIGQNDYLGIFCDSAGYMRCVGSAKWGDFTEGNKTITAYGAEKGRFGFEEGDAIHLMWWRAQEACQQSGVLTMTGDATFKSNGHTNISKATFNSVQVAYSQSFACHDDTLLQLVALPHEGTYSFKGSPSGLALDSLTGTIKPNQSTPGRYELQVNSRYCVSIATPLIDILPAPRSILDPSTGICPDAHLALDAGNGFAKVDWYVSGEHVGQGRLMTIDQAANYVLRLTDEKGCMGFDTLEVYEKYLPEAQITVTQTECGIKNLDAHNDFWSSYDWSNGSQDAFVKVDRSGTYIVELEGKNQCTSSAQVDIEVNEMTIKDLTYEYGEANCVRGGAILINESTLTHGKFPFTYKMIEQNTGFYDTTRSMTGVFKELEVGLYDLQITDSYGCEETYFGLSIDSSEDCDQVSFTPNGDGIDDSYFIEKEGVVNIYDRNGNLQYHLEAPGYWDGINFNNQPLGTGYYLIVVNDQVVNGVTLIR